MHCRKEIWIDAWQLLKIIQRIVIGLNQRGRKGESRKRRIVGLPVVFHHSADVCQTCR